MRRAALFPGLLLAALVPLGAGAAPVTLGVLDVVPAGLTQGLVGASGVAASPDGADVYVTSTGDALLHFRWDGEALRFVAIHRQGVAGVTGLDGARSPVVSPDGAHVYAAGTDSDTVAVFARDAGTGALAFVGAAAGIAALDEPRALALSPDGAHVYVASTRGNAIVAFARHAGTGALTLASTAVEGAGGAAGLVGPRALVVSDDGAHVYVAATPLANGTLAAYTRTAATGELAFVQLVTDGATAGALRGATAVVASADGAHVYVASAQSHAIAAFARAPGTGTLAFLGAVFDDVGDADGLRGASALWLPADGAHVYAAGPSEGALVRLARDPATGLLTWLQKTVLPTDAISTTPDGSRLYAAGANGLTVFDRDGTSGALALVDQKSNARLSAAAVTPDGAHVYVPSAGDAAIVTFARDAGTGALTRTGVLYDGVDDVAGLALPRDVLPGPDGAQLYVAATARDGAGNVVVLTRDPGTGMLAPLERQIDGVGGVDGVAGATRLAWSPGGAHLYVAGGGEAAVAVFARDAGTGFLTFVEREREGEGGVSGLSTPLDVAVSPDGAHVYAATSGGRVAAFARDPGTGALTFVESIFAVGAFGTVSVAVSPDGAQVYVGGSSAVVTLARNATTGQLVAQDADVNGELEVEGLGSLRRLVPSADGAQLFTGSVRPGVFEREPGGSLDFVHVIPQGSGAALDLAFAPGGAHAYAPTTAGDVIVLGRGFGGCAPAPAAGCRRPGEPGKAKLLAAADADPTRSRLTWKWVAKGEPTGVPDFGDPLAGTHYALCVYDESGPPALLVRALAPAGSRWRASPTSFRYKVKFLLPRAEYGVPEGMEKLVLRASSLGRARLKVQAKGAKLRLPPLPFPLPLRVQLQAANDECWESTFPAAGVQRNDATAFIATSD